MQRVNAFLTHITLVSQHFTFAAFRLVCNSTFSQTAFSLSGGITATPGITFQNPPQLVRYLVYFNVKFAGSRRLGIYHDTGLFGIYSSGSYIIIL